MAKLFRGQFTNPRIRLLELSNANPARLLFEREFFDDPLIAVTGTGAAAVNGPTVSASGTVEVAAITGSGAASIGGPAVAGSGTVSVPAVAGAAAFSIAGPTVAGVGTGGAAAITGSGAVSIAGPVLICLGTSFGPGFYARTARAGASLNGGRLLRAANNGRLKHSGQNGGRILGSH